MNGADPAVDVDPLAIARRRYRLLLLSYPPSWRREHGEALLGTCLDAAAERRGPGPTAREGLDLLLHGLAWRLRLLAPSEQTRRIAAVLALMVGTATAMACFVAAEWQPGVAPSGWRVEPGHVGPFATLGPVFYAVWVAAFAATLAGREILARRLLIGSIVAGLVVHGVSLTFFTLAGIAGRTAAHPSSDLFDLRRPPGQVLALLIPLALIGCLGRLAWRVWERWLIALTTTALTGLLMAVAAPDGTSRVWADDRAYAFYRSSGFRDMVHFQTSHLAPLSVLVALLAWRWRPQWLPATLILSVAGLPFAPLPGAVLAEVDLIWTRFTGSSLSWWIDDAVLTMPLTLAALATSIWWRWRTGRTRPLRAAGPGST